MRHRSRAWLAWMATGALLGVTVGAGAARAQQRPAMQVRRLQDSAQVPQRARTARVLPQRRLMPPLVDSTEDVARAILSGMRISPVIIDRRMSDPRRDGRVSGQRPAAGQALTVRDTVTLVIDRYVRPTAVTVPHVVGRPLMEAIRTLRDSSLTPRPPRISGADIRHAVVDSQTPGPGVRVRAGSPVTLSVTVTTVVPGVVGRDVPMATGILASAGLAIRFRAREYSDTMTAGRVLRQHPDSGTTSRPGDSVDVWLSLGAHPPDPGFPMPRLVDLTLNDARDTLQANRLRVTHVDTLVNAARAGYVVSQKPLQGAPVHAGDVVDLQVAIAPRPRRVPWVVGRSRAEASRLLADSGFAVRVAVVPDSVRSDDLVIGQRPDSGIPRRPVTVVTINVVDSVGPPPPQPRSMPRVFGMTRDDAAGTLAFLSPRLTVSERPTAREEEDGRVVDQYPLPEAPVFPDLEVLLTFGRYEPQRLETPAVPAQPAIVPQLLRRRIGEARALLAQANLRLGDMSGRFEVAPESVVVGQNPDSGAAVLQGTPVSVELQQAAPAPGSTGGQDGDDGIDWYWWLLIPAGIVAAYEGLRLIRHSPRVHAELKQRPFEPPRVVRRDEDPVVALEIAFVSRAPGCAIEAPDSLILREERL